MEEKGKWYYSRGGKAFRGFLCLVTFVAFMAGLMFTVLAKMHFGGIVFSVNPPDYYDSICYGMDVEGIYNSLLGSVAALESKADNENLRIIDTSTNQIRSYNLQQIGDTYTSGEYPDNIGTIQCELVTEQKEFPFYNYTWALKKLESESEEGSYLYFSRQSFKELFMKCGEQNTDHKYLEEYSEEAYFVFINPKEIYRNNEDTEDGSVIDIGDMDYAVYDPVEDIYYSTWDDYFAPYDSYLYDCRQVLSKIDEYTEGDRTKLTNIVLPLLWSENISMSQLLSEKVGNDEVNNAKQNLKDMEQDAFLYYVECESRVYKNVESVEEITNQRYSYLVEQGHKNYQAAKVQNSVTSIPGHEDCGCFETRLNEYFEDKPVAVYFGIDEIGMGHMQDSDYGMALQYHLYQTVSTYALPVLVLTAVAFILLLIQAVSLIVTTGRKGRKNIEQGINTEIKLNFYDKLPVEIWFVITLALLAAAGMLAGVFLYDGYDDVELVWTMLLAATVMVPFGLCFMLLALSFARRIKAKNLTENMCTYRIYRWCRKKGTSVCKKCMRSYYRKHGADRMWILFVVYLCCMLLVVFLTVVFRYDPEPGNFVIVIFIVVNICALATVRRMYKDMKQIAICVENITKGDLNSKCDIKERRSFFTELADGVNHIGDGLKAAVETSLKDERMKTELITNVSHDLKTPLTSIINYVDLLKKEEMQSEEAKHYLEVLDGKSQRLKQLTEDLVEAAKANSGNIELTCMPLAFDELMRQAVGEFEDKFVSKKLTVVTSYPEEPAMIMADGRRLYRIIENVLQNAYKYALEGTRIYADLTKDGGVVAFTLKNVSAAQLNISPEELMERFTRGDASRTTEGSGLGLSIAKDLTGLMKGNFEIRLDGDLFKVIVSFPEYKA